MNAKQKYIASLSKPTLRLTNKQKPTLQVTPKVYKTKKVRIDRIG